MPDFEMPYFADNKGDKGYFVDPTAREQITQLTTALANLDGVKPVTTTVDCTVQNIYNLFKGLDKNKIHTIRATGGQTSASIFGGSGLTMIGLFTSNNYGFVLCLSDNASNGIRHICINDGSVAYLQTPTVNVTQISVS